MITTTKKTYRNLSVPELVELSLAKSEGFLASNGALVVRTGKCTGRSPGNRYIVDEPTTKSAIQWGKVNVATSEEKFDEMFAKAEKYLSDKDLFQFDGFAGADHANRLPIRVIAEKAWHGLFAHTLFKRPTAAELANFAPGFTVIGAGFMPCETFVAINFKRKLVLVAGTGYGGEMKKSIFSVMNYLLPERGVFPMHCSANVGKGGDTALFFGLSGTGKTTLSADPERRLIGDDEHGWSDTGIFNFEGGCYAKVIQLSHEAEPQIYDAIKFGSLLENVIVDDKTRVIDYDSAAITENTRATYPVEYIPGCITEGVGAHPKNIFFLTCDAFGVLPPIAKLDPEMAMYHFLSGYTAKVAGTEVGITEPTATFSSCFGEPFLPLPPKKYAEMLGDKLRKHNANCWLVNTGWSGGAYGVGKRMSIKVTRALLTAALNGSLEKVKFTPDPVFKVLVPERCDGVETALLTPVNMWQDKNAYNETAKKLSELFVKNYKRFW